MRTCSAQSAAGPRVSSHTTPPMVHDAGAGAATVPTRTVPDAQSVAGLLADDAVGRQPLVALVRRERVDARQPERVVGTGQGVPQRKQHLLGAQCCGAACRRAGRAPPIVQIGPGAGGGGVVSGSVGGVGGSEGGGAANAVTPGTSTTAARKAASSARAVRCAPTRLPRPNMDGNSTWLLHRDHPQPLVAPRRSRISVRAVLDDRADAVGRCQRGHVEPSAVAVEELARAAHLLDGARRVAAVGVRPVDPPAARRVGRPRGRAPTCARRWSCPTRGR